MNILLVYPLFPDTFWSFKHALRFIDKKASSPPLGLATIAAMLPAGWQKRLVDMNVTSLRATDLAWADMVWISAMIVQRASAEEVIQLARQAGKPIVAGGPLFTAEPEKYAQVDHLVLNEGEITLPRFLEDLSHGRPGRLYQSDSHPELSMSPVPLWELVDIRQYDSMSIQFSRGCPFNCDFCNITTLLGHRPRTKSAAQIIAELDAIYALGWRRNIFFVDDNFIGNKRVLKESVLPALIEWRRGKSGCQFITEASINLADDAELMDLMVQAGFHSVFVGIETPSEAALSECHKTQNKNRSLLESVRRLQHHGLQVMGGFIVGFDSDTPGIFQRQVDFIQASGIVTAMVGLLQAPIGTELYRRLQREGRVNHAMSGDNADGLTNIIPKMDLRSLQRGYHAILEQIYAPHPFFERVRTFLREYRPGQSPVRVEGTELLAFVRSIYWMGIRSPARREYWRFLAWALHHQPGKFSLAITFTIYWYHFWHVFSQHILPNQLPPEPASAD